MKHCIDCGKEHETIWQRCGACHYQRSGRLGNEGRVSGRKENKHRFHCEHCGKLSYRGPGGFTLKHGYKNRWCSRVCQKAWHAARRKPLFRAVHPCADCGALIRKVRDRCITCAAAHQARLRQERIDARTWQGRPKRCLACKSEFVTIAKRQRFCSGDCKHAHQLAQRRKGRREHRKKYGRKWRALARRYGVIYETVWRNKVFERDGWRCQICGCQTLRAKEKRNSREATLDHRVPISRGGPHTYGNVQCACRACNEEKGNKMALGQLSLQFKELAGGH